MTEEVRIIDPISGGAKGQKDVQLSMVPTAFLEDLGRLYGFGAEKYDRGNWRLGYAWHLCYDALLRHLLASMRGEWYDSESGLPHVVAVAWHAAALHTFYKEGLGTDDRNLDPSYEDSRGGNARPTDSGRGLDAVRPGAQSVDARGEPDHPAYLESRIPPGVRYEDWLRHVGWLPSS